MALQKILVATDFSPNAKTALDVAVALARPLGASIHLLHVIQLPVSIASPTESISLPVAYWESMRRLAEDRLAQLKNEVTAQKLTCTIEALEDIPGFAIAAAAKRVHADLIVMGSRGLTGLKHFALGSVAERTARSAECPVLTVKHESATTPLRTILVPVDFSPASNAALALAKSLAAKLGPSHLILAHAFHIPAELQQYIGVKDGFVEKLSRAVNKELEKTLAELKKDRISAEQVTLEGTPEQVVLDLAKSRKVDLIVMGTHGRRGLSHMLLGSVAERVLRLAAPPVLTVRPPAER